MSGLRKKLQWLDPFTYADKFIIPKLQTLSQNAKLLIFIACILVVVFLFQLIIFQGSIDLVSFSGWSFFLIIAFYFGLKEDALAWSIYLLEAFVVAFIIFSLVGIGLDTQSPMVIVVSQSMEPLYNRGDIIVLQGASAEQLQGNEVYLSNQTLATVPFSTIAVPKFELQRGSLQITEIEFNEGQTIPITKEGSIVVYYSHYRKQPIIHRVVALLHAADGWYVLTKGDSINNSTIDQDCGYVNAGVPDKTSCISLYPVPVSQLQGKAILQVPFIGCVKLWLIDDLGSLIATGKLPANFNAYC